MKREIYKKVLELVEEGVLDPMEVLEAALMSMSEAKVLELVESNEFLSADDLDVLQDGDDEDDDDEGGSRYYDEDEEEDDEDY